MSFIFTFSSFVLSRDFSQIICLATHFHVVLIRVARWYYAILVYNWTNIYHPYVVFNVCQPI